MYTLSYYIKDIVKLGGKNIQKKKEKGYVHIKVSQFGNIL